MGNHTELLGNVDIRVAYNGMLETFPKDFFQDRESGLSKEGVMIEYYASKDVYWTARVESSNSEKEIKRAKRRVTNAQKNLGKLKSKYYYD